MMSPDERVCALCGAPAKLTNEGIYRHSGQPFEDASAFCEKYGYPIPTITRRDLALECEIQAHEDRTTQAKKESGT
jgi:hypothetical protein